ncbi:hypothetical protein [Winogradskya humida]|uniref:hypothetical protein n=1 Tax=Winogradskya humida TaxID=113566 RepID=UPI00194160DE|nr:hypothetical protein [Actinoplanes humidus]
MRGFFSACSAASPSKPIVVCDDITRLARKATTGENIPIFQDLLTGLDPLSRDFGTDVQTLVTCSDGVGLLRTTWPITGIRIEPTTHAAGIDPAQIVAARDGGFLVLVTIMDTVTVASDRVPPEWFPLAPHTPQAVMAAVVATAHTLYRSFLSAARQVG